MNKIIYGIIFLLSISIASALQLPQLTYHHMGIDNVSEYVTKEQFSAQMSWLYQNGFNSCSFAYFLNNSCNEKSFIAGMMYVVGGFGGGGSKR